MDINQAIEHANAFVIPGLLVDDQSIIGEVNKNCDAIKTLLDAWKEAPLGQEPVEFSVIQQLADRTRSLCDTYGVERLRNHRGVGLSRSVVVLRLSLKPQVLFLTTCKLPMSRRAFLARCWALILRLRRASLSWATLLTWALSSGILVATPLP